MKNSTPAPRRRRRRLPSHQKSETCQLCFAVLPRITAEHLRAHGLTVSAYSRIYGPSPSPAALADSARRAPGSHPLPGLLDETTRHRLAEHLLSDPDFIFRAADEVSDILATGPIRDRVRIAIGAVLESRLVLQGQALSSLRKAHEQLSQPWRLEQLPDGSPLPTAQLLQVVAALGAEVSRGEDLILRTGRLVLEEQRTRISAGLATVEAAARFKGGETNVPMPPADTTPEERENMRIMLSILTSSVEGRRARPVDSPAVRALPGPPSSNVDPGPSQAPSPARAPVPSFERAPDHVIRERVRALTTRESAHNVHRDVKPANTTPSAHHTSEALEL